MRPGKARPIVRRDTAEGKPKEIAACGEEDDGQDGEKKTGNGVTEDDDGARPNIKAAAVAHRFANAERDRDEIADERRPQAQRDRNRQLLPDEAHHRRVAVEARAEIKGEVVADHDPEALGRRLVEAIELVELSDEFRIEAACAARLILAGGGAAAHFAAAAAYAPERAGVGALELSDQLLDRPTRRGLHDDEVHQDDGEQCRDHQQDAADQGTEYRSGRSSPP